MEREFDAPWKETLDHFLSELLQFFMPEVWGTIDWSVPPENLETELQKIIGDAAFGTTTADRLFKLKERDTADPIYLLLHVEVQAQVDQRLPQRMYLYHNRIMELYGQHPISVAILADDSPNWRPTRYEWAKAGCQVVHQFNAIKLWDWHNRIDELLASDNIIGLAVVAHLQSHLTVDDITERYRWKRRLIELIDERGLDVLQMYLLNKVVDWFVNLPELLERRFSQETFQIRQEKSMSRVTNYERYIESLIEQQIKAKITIKLVTAQLNKKFGQAGAAYAAELKDMIDDGLLERVIEAILDANTIDELKRIVAVKT
jgi:hypothetical protein